MESDPLTTAQKWKVFRKDLICGSFAGLACVISGHPLDLMKVRMQSS